jgi:hypothetical protein
MAMSENSLIGYLTAAGVVIFGIDLLLVIAILVKELAL